MIRITAKIKLSAKQECSAACAVIRLVCVTVQIIRETGNSRGSCELLRSVHLLFLYVEVVLLIASWFTIILVPSN